jgi:uncharacterized membrane protein YidH (DUF202 family)
MPNSQELLGPFKDIRGNINIFIVLLAFVLSVMIIDTHNKCKSSDPVSYQNNTQFSFIVAIIIVIFSCLIFGYDLANIFGLFK